MNGNVAPSHSPYVSLQKNTQILRALSKIKRNIICPFTNLKFKKCCGSSGQNFCNKAMEQLNNCIKDLNPSDG